jgi:hypothetical protein
VVFAVSILADIISQCILFHIAAAIKLSDFFSMLKKMSTHAHFMSVFAVIICLFTAPHYVWPHGLGIAATTFLMAFTIPPFGMMETSQLKPDQEVQKEAEDEKKKKKAATKGGNNKKKKKN